MDSFQSANTCVVINGTPYAFNSLSVSYNGDAITVRHFWYMNTPLINNVAYSNITGDGEPFASLADMKAFVVDHFFGPGGSTPPPSDSTFLVSESGVRLITEDGKYLILE